MSKVEIKDFVPLKLGEFAEILAGAVEAAGGTVWVTAHDVRERFIEAGHGMPSKVAVGRDLARLVALTEQHCLKGLSVKRSDDEGKSRGRLYMIQAVERHASIAGLPRFSKSRDGSDQSQDHLPPTQSLPASIHQPSLRVSFSCGDGYHDAVVECNSADDRFLTMAKVLTVQLRNLA